VNIKPLTLAEVADLLGGELICNDPDIIIAGVQTLMKAKANQASFLTNMKYKNEVVQTRQRFAMSPWPSLFYI